MMKSTLLTLAATLALAPAMASAAIITIDLGAASNSAPGTSVTISASFDSAQLVGRTGQISVDGLMTFGWLFSSCDVHAGQCVGDDDVHTERTWVENDMIMRETVDYTRSAGLSVFVTDAGAIDPWRTRISQQSSSSTCQTSALFGWLCAGSGSQLSVDAHQREWWTQYDSYGYGSWSEHNAGTITSATVSPIPEPAGALALGLGLAGLMLRRRLAT